MARHAAHLCLGRAAYKGWGVRVASRISDRGSRTVTPAPIRLQPFWRSFPFFPSVLADHMFDSDLNRLDSHLREKHCVHATGRHPRAHSLHLVGCENNTPIASFRERDDTRHRAPAPEDAP